MTSWWKQSVFSIHSTQQNVKMLIFMDGKELTNNSNTSEMISCYAHRIVAQASIHQCERYKWQAHEIENVMWVPQQYKTVNNGKHSLFEKRKRNKSCKVQCSDNYSTWIINYMFILTHPVKDFHFQKARQKFIQLINS